MTSASVHGRACFLHACELDVAVRKPGNVSRASPGHGMTADQFVASARAAAGPLFVAGTRVGERIERAVAASWAVAGCNTNLGIVLLAAPLAAAIERAGALDDAAALHGALEAVLDALDIDDARRVFAAITHAGPGGLGEVPAQDVRQAPTIGLRAAMTLAADRDSIARQYANGYLEIFEVALPLLHSGFARGCEADRHVVTAAETAAVQRVFLEFLAHIPDSHIVRKHGAAVAHTVMTAAQPWLDARAPAPGADFAAWDESLKSRGINPGTSADLTVAALLVADLLSLPGRRWHGS